MPKAREITLELVHVGLSLTVHSFVIGGVEVRLLLLIVLFLFLLFFVIFVVVPCQLTQFSGMSGLRHVPVCLGIGGGPFVLVIKVVIIVASFPHILVLHLLNHLGLLRADIFVDVEYLVVDPPTNASGHDVGMKPGEKHEKKPDDAVPNSIGRYNNQICKRSLKV